MYIVYNKDFIVFSSSQMSFNLSLSISLSLSYTAALAKKQTGACN